MPGEAFDIAVAYSGQSGDRPIERSDVKQGSVDLVSVLHIDAEDGMPDPAVLVAGTYVEPHAGDRVHHDRDHYHNREEVVNLVYRLL